MTRFIDNNGKIAEITLINNGYEWQDEFFNVGSLSYNEDSDAYKVEDVDYLIDQANDYISGFGDFSDGEPQENAELVYEIK